MPTSGRIWTADGHKSIEKPFSHQYYNRKVERKDIFNDCELM